MMCIGSGLGVYTTEAGYSNYTWTITSGGSIVSGQGTYQIEVNWTNPGNKTVTVNYETTYGCAAPAPASFSVSVMGLPGNPGQIMGTDQVCAGTLYVSYDTPPIPNADDYIWTLPYGATIVEGENTRHIKVDFALDAVSGTITVHGENLCGSGQESQPFSLTVDPLPPAPEISMDPDYLMHSTALLGNQWYLDGILIPGATDPDYQAVDEGWYWAVVTLNGCSSDTSNNIYVLFVGLDEPSGSNFSVYPVPNDGRFNITMVTAHEDTYSINIYNDLGMKVFEKDGIRVNGTAQQTIDLNNPAKGIYTIVLQGNNQTVIRKVLVTK